jgi:hypothetical protein
MLKSPRVLEIILFFLVLTLYIHNLSRSIYAGDSGLLVAASYVGGIVHPPGYPLFTILGFLISRASFISHLSPAFLVGTLSATASALAVVIYFRIATHVSKNTLVSLISSLILTSIYIFWHLAEIPEVFALNNLFALLQIYLSLCYLKTKSKKSLYLLAFFTGLSLTNHFTILLVFPSILLIISPQLKRVFASEKRILFSALLIGMCGLLPYFYVIGVSFLKPAIDWGHITGFQSFLSFVIRERYGTFNAGYFDDPGIVNRSVSLTGYLSTQVSNLTYPVLVVCIIGAAAGMWKRSRLAIAIFLGFVLSGPLFFIFAGFPFDSYFHRSVAERFMALSIIILLLYFPIGLDQFSKKLGKYFSRPIYTVFFSGIFILIPIQLFILNYPKTDLSQVTIGDDLGKNYLTYLPQNSILLLASDTSLFNTLYVHYALGVRKDITILNALEPDEINRVLRTKSDHIDEPIETKLAHVAFLRNIETIDSSYPVFSEVPFEGNDAVSWVPYGLVYELRRSIEPELSAQDFTQRTSKIWKSLDVPLFREISQLSAKTIGVSAIYNAYNWILWHTGVYFHKTYQDEQRYGEYMLKSIEVSPDFPLGYASLGSYFLNVRKDCSMAILDYKQAHEKDPTNKQYFQLLAIGYKQCHTGGDTLKELKAEYKKLFGEELKQ